MFAGTESQKHRADIKCAGKCLGAVIKLIVACLELGINVPWCSVHTGKTSSVAKGSYQGITLHSSFVIVYWEEFVRVSFSSLQIEAKHKFFQWTWREKCWRGEKKCLGHWEEIQTTLTNSDSQQARSCPWVLSFPLKYGFLEHTPSSMVDLRRGRQGQTTGRMTTQTCEK